jgi:potassium channel subfamily K
VKPVSENLDAFFECFAAHHAIVDPLTGRFNLSFREHKEAVSILTHMLQRHGKNGLLPLSEFETPSLAQRWSFLSRGALSVATCNRIIQLVRISAFGKYVDVHEFIETVLVIEHRRLRKAWEILMKISAVTLYYVFGCLYYCNVEGWSIINSVYFTTISVSTIGYGDLTCSSDSCRGFTVFYVGFGIVLIVGLITSMVISILSSYEERVVEIGRGIMELHPDGRKRKIFYLYALHILYASILLGFPLILGAVMFWLMGRNEMEVTLVMAFYWSAQTCMTIGYGDLRLMENKDKIWICCFVFLAIACVSAAIAQIGSLRMKIQAYKRQEMLQNKRLALSLVSQLDVNEQGVSKFEYLAACLVSLEKVKPEEVANILNQFDELDVDKTGVLTLSRLANLRQSHKLARLVSGIPSGLGRLTSDETLEGMSRYVPPFAESDRPTREDSGEMLVTSLKTV